jgi:hypothetical protein
MRLFLLYSVFNVHFRLLFSLALPACNGAIYVRFSRFFRPHPKHLGISRMETVECFLLKTSLRFATASKRLTKNNKLYMIFKDSKIKIACRPGDVLLSQG